MVTGSPHQLCSVPSFFHHHRTPEPHTPPFFFVFFLKQSQKWHDSYSMQLFNVPKSNVAVIRGAKARDKTLSINDLDLGGDSEEAFLEKARRRLDEAVVKK